MCLESCEKLDQVLNQLSLSLEAIKMEAKGLVMEVVAIGEGTAHC